MHAIIIYRKFLNQEYLEEEKMFKKIPFHIILTPAYFVVAQFNQNISEVFPEDLVRPIIAVILISLILFLSIKLAIKNSQRAALVVTVLFFFFFLYGLVYGALKTINISSGSLARHRFLLPLFLISMVVLAQKFGRLKNNVGIWTQLFNTFSIALLMIPTLNILLVYKTQTASRNEQTNSAQTSTNATIAVDETQPDVYYIIADAYGRSDYLMDEYDFDNNDFLNWLEEKGFFVADCARSNYAHTALSLSSALQMNYISEFASENQYYDGGLDDYIVHNTVRDELEARGYQIISFENVHWDFYDADVFYDFKTDFFSPYLRPFENLLLTNSMFRAVVEFNSGTQEYFSVLTSTPVKEHYLRQAFILDTLENETINLDGPKFVFAHIETPHGPYVFDENGEFIEEDAFYRGEYYSAINDTYGDLGYIKQIKFMNTRLENIVEKILQESETPPIIIIQGDHSIDEFGTPENRMKILYAIYLPDGNYSSLHSTITPVNTFRIIFNQYFGTNYDLLEDRSFYSQRTDRFSWQEVWEDSIVCHQ